MEVGQKILSLDFFAHQLEFPECHFIILQISQRALEHAALETIGGDLGTLCPGHQGLADLADVEHGGCLDVIPVFFGERVNTEMDKKENISNGLSLVLMLLLDKGLFALPM